MEFLTYDLKVAVLLAVFYMFYRVLLSRDTLHRLNRMVLLTTAVASFVLPLCVITMHETVVVNATRHIDIGGLSAAVEEKQPLAWWQMALPVIYIIGVAATLAHTLVSVLKVWLIIRSSEHHPQVDGIIVCVTDKDVSPFSWMRYIVLNRQDYESPDPAIMAHERGHIRQRHSLDVLLVDTLTVVQWFNPAMWMLRQDLRTIHEYEADAAVLSQGINMRQYQYLLIQKAVAACGYSVANGITHSTLKNRITMMLKNKKSPRKSMFKLLALLPIVGTVLALQAETVTDYVYASTVALDGSPVEQQQKPVKKGRKAGQIKVGAKTIEVQTDEGTYTGENVMMSLGDADLGDDQLIIIDTVANQGEPLIIIDGKRVTTAQLEALDSKTIDHVDVLKEKSAVEVYGEEGKNGVVIITTKSGKGLFLGEAKVDSTVIQYKAKMETTSEFPDVFDVVEQMPEFPGGPEALMQFLMENVCYPEAAFKTGVQGRVLVTFIVDTEGRVNNAKVVKKVNDDLDAEAIRVVGSMPRWKPGKQNGKVVRVRYTMPITFRLD